MNETIATIGILLVIVSFIGWCIWILIRKPVHKFLSWPNKMEALENIRAGKPADTPIERTIGRGFDQLPPIPSLRPKPNPPPPPPRPHYTHEDLERHPNVLEEVYGGRLDSNHPFQYNPLPGDFIKDLNKKVRKVADPQPLDRFDFEEE